MLNKSINQLENWKNNIILWLLQTFQIQQIILVKNQCEDIHFGIFECQNIGKLTLRM